MKTIDLEKLQKQEKLKAVKIKPNGKYLFVFDSNYLSTGDIESLSKAKIIRNGEVLIVNGKPDDVMAIYEVKEQIAKQ